MDDRIAGRVFVLGDNIDTDQIIPAEYLTYNPAIPEERRMFGRLALSGVPGPHAGLPRGNVPFVDLTDPERTTSEFSVIVAGRNFGCGSSREHAPLALREAGVRVVVAESYARIFFRNAVNGGHLIPCETASRLVDEVSTGDSVLVDLGARTLRVTEGRGAGRSFPIEALGDITPIIEAGGLFAYARKVGMIGGGPAGSKG